MKPRSLRFDPDGTMAVPVKPNLPCPRKAGIQGPSATASLDTRFRGYDNVLRS